MKLILLIFFVIFVNSLVLAQNNDIFDKRNYYDFGKKLHLEVHFLPSNNVDSISAMILFRFTNDMISFEKQGINKADNNRFFSVPKLEVEFEDSVGIIRGVVTWQDTIYLDNFDQTISKTEFLKGILNIKLIGGEYKVNARLSDQNISNIKKISLNDSSEYNFLNNEIIGKPIFALLTKENENIYKPYILQNNITFSSSSSIILVPVSFKDEFTKYHYSCIFNKDKKSAFIWNTDYNINALIVPEKNSEIIINDNMELSTQTTTIIETEIKFGFLKIILPIEGLVPGEYNLNIVKDGSKDTLKETFNVIWEDMPYILQKPRYALESMFYILTDDEYEKMLDADYNEYSKQIIDYWKKEDPTNYTPFNESMFEYFKRVDYSLFNFKTMNEKNGIKSDRGKIYILYGKPTKTDRTLADDKTLEIWEYDHLKKKFLFETNSQGNYKLIEINDF